MTDAWIDRTEDGRIVVSWDMDGAAPARQLFTDRDDAEEFAMSLLGKLPRQGIVTSTLNMNSSQWDAEKARRQRGDRIINEARWREFAYPKTA